MMPPFGLEDQTSCVAAAEKYLEHGLALGAIQILGIYRSVTPGGLPIGLVLDVLERAVSQLGEGGRPDAEFAYHVEELIDTLEEADGVDQVRLARVEWAYLPLLDHRHHKPRLLHRELAENPEFFIEVLSLVYHAEGEERRQLTSEEQGRWRVAHELLDSWHTPPGCRVDGTVDGDALVGWVAEARRLAEAAGRRAIGDTEIGQVLIHVPPGPDAQWPHPAVCGIIEKAASKELERGFDMGMFNGRGVVTKRLTDGGTDERATAERYARSATAVAVRFPRTAAMLRSMADTYGRMAAKEDADANLRQDLGL